MFTKRRVEHKNRKAVAMLRAEENLDESKIAALLDNYCLQM